MYQVHEHREGIKASIGLTGLLWEHDFYGHEWTCIHECRRKADTIAAANACPIHATVTRSHHSHVEHDNGKEPGNRVTDQRTDKTIPIRAPRGLEAYRLKE